MLIAGAAGFYGRAIAQRLAADGWRVHLADRDATAVHDLARALGGEALMLDVTDRAAVRRAVGDTVFAGLVNAVGGPVDTAPFTTSNPADWAPLIDHHFGAVLNCCHAVLPGMLAARRGAILSLAAGEGLRGDPRRPLYSVAKAAVIVLSEQRVRDCLPAGVRVNTLVPPHASAPIAAGAAAAGHVAEAAAWLLSDRAALTTGACIDLSGGWALH